MAWSAVNPNVRALLQLAIAVGTQSIVDVSGKSCRSQLVVETGKRQPAKLGLDTLGISRREDIVAIIMQESRTNTCLDTQTVVDAGTDILAQIPDIVSRICEVVIIISINAGRCTEVDPFRRAMQPAYAGAYAG